MSDQNVRMIMLSTEDLDASIAFYESLEMTLKFRDGSHFAALDAGSVTLALAPTHRLSVIELVGLMLASSDNRVAEHVMTLVGAERATQAVRSIGCDDTTLTIGFADEHLGPAGRANLTTAIDCATALTALMTDPMFAAVRPALRSSLFNTRILSALPDNIVVSHKTGSLAGVVNDVGVVHAPGGRLTVCFLTDAQTDAATTSAAIGRCTRELFDAFIDAEVRR